MHEEDTGSADSRLKQTASAFAAASVASVSSICASRLCLSSFNTALVFLQTAHRSAACKKTIAGLLVSGAQVRLFAEKEALTRCFADQCLTALGW